ncbi:unnamed protein product [Diplocarpon coronariae]|uniref:Apple domain-containing protein n=1 Tax=Diplocarpon coronariae TaxID=2795749 RepID=A0A218Z1Z2_9HELO|nr:hypothetical protein B2J93_4594 [Marssonina coronariae]
MQLVAVCSAAALLNTVLAIQPAGQELVKKDSHRQARWWRWGPNRHQSEAATSGDSGASYPVAVTEAAGSLSSGLRPSSLPVSYSYPNATSAALSSPASAVPTETSTITSTITLMGNTTRTLTIEPASSAANATSASNYTRTSRIPSSPPLPTSLPPRVTILPINASAISNFTSFTAVPLPLASSGAPPTTLQPSTLPTSRPSSRAESSTADLISLVSISAEPVFTAAPSAVLHPSSSVSQTTVVTEGEATGIPNAGALHCGVHGLPNGAYKMAEYWEDRRNVGVTLLGCYEFCDGANNGCFSYSFYREEVTGAPRCDLFGGSVADSLDSIINEVPRIWYDVGCGNPLLYSG